MQSDLNNKWVGKHASLYLLQNHAKEFDLTPQLVDLLTRLISHVDVRLDILKFAKNNRPGEKVVVSELIPSNVLNGFRPQVLAVSSEIKRVISDHNFFVIQLISEQTSFEFSPAVLLYARKMELALQRKQAGLP